MQLVKEVTGRTEASEAVRTVVRGVYLDGLLETQRILLNPELQPNADTLLYGMDHKATVAKDTVRRMHEQSLSAWSPDWVQLLFVFETLSRPGAHPRASAARRSYGPARRKMRRLRPIRSTRPCCGF